MFRLVLVGSVLAVSCFAQARTSAPSIASGTAGAHYGSGPRYGYGYGTRARSRGSVYAYPVYVGGYGYYGDPGYAAGAGYGPGYPPQGYADPSQQAPPAPPVVINQYFGGPGPMAPPDAGDPNSDPSIRMYQQQPSGAGYSAPAVSDAHTYLIAYKDHSVYSALAYWIEGQTLHYVTTANTHNQADLNLIDIEFTKKLNADRSMPFNVPAQ